MDRSEFIEALHLIEKEKGIDKEIIFEAIEASLVSACKKNFGSNQNIKVVIDRETGNVACYAQREVVEEVMDEQNEIDLMAARILNPSYQIGDTVDLEVSQRLRPCGCADSKTGSCTEIQRSGKRNPLQSVHHKRT